MQSFLRFVGGVGVALVLGGCASTQVVSSSPRTVIVKATVYAAAEAQALADQQCKEHGRLARLVGKTRPTEYIFDCVN